MENVLEHSQPGPNFAHGVLAALPALAARNAAATKPAGGVIGLAGLVKVLPWLGAVAGAGAGLFAMWDIVRNTPTLATRRYTLRGMAWAYGAIWMFFAFIAFAYHLDPPWSAWLIGGGWVFYGVAGAVAGARFSRVFHGMVQRAWANGGEDRASDLPESSHLERDFRWGLAAAMAGGIATSLSASNGALDLSAPVVFSMIFACHIAFLVLYRRGLGISADRAAFEASPPIAERSLAVMAGSQPAPNTSTARSAWLAAIAAVALLGPFTPIAIGCHLRDADALPVAAVLCVAGFVVATLTLFRTHRQRMWFLSAGIAVAGTADAVLIELGYWPMAGPQWHLHLVALLYACGHWGHAVATIRQLRPWTSAKEA